MGKQKTKAPGPGRELSATKVTKVQSEVKRFRQKWGMELTAQETNKVVDRATANISNAESEIKVRHAVRNQMFAMLIEKSPAKAIKMRMEMYEKKGKSVTGAQKTRVMTVAKEKGFRAARMELNSIVKAKKPKKKEKIKRVGAGGRGKIAKRKPKALETPTKKKWRDVVEVKKRKKKREKKGGLTIAQMLGQAKELNARMMKVASEYDKEARTLEKATTKRFEKQFQDVENRMYATIEEFKAKDPQYKKDIKDVEDRMLAKLNGLKRNRDAALTKAVLGMGYPKEVAWIIRETAGTRGFESSMGEITIRKFDKRVLSRGNIEENCNEFERYTDQKTLSKESKEALELFRRAIFARREAEESKKG